MTVAIERAIAVGQARASGWDSGDDDLIILDQRARDRVAEEEFLAVRVLLADGQQLVRAGLRELLEEGGDIVVVAEAASGREAVTLASEIRPDVVLMNVRLPDLDGLEATLRITTQAKSSQTRVLILSDDEDDEALFAAFRAGASALLTRDTDPGELVRAVRVLARGGVQLSPTVTRHLIDEFASQPDPQRSTPAVFEELTSREREVVALVALGLNNDQIAEQLAVSAATVKTHVGRSMVKLHVRDRAKLVALAYQTGFAQPRHDRGPAGSR